MSNLEFHIGARVVCVDDGFKHTSPEIATPLRGVVYTIRGVHHVEGVIAFTLAELSNPSCTWISYPGFVHYDCEPFFGARRFRPVRETSIDCFTALLEQPPVRQTELI